MANITIIGKSSPPITPMIVVAVNIVFVVVALIIVDVPLIVAVVTADVSVDDTKAVYVEHEEVVVIKTTLQTVLSIVVHVVTVVITTSMAVEHVLVLIVEI